MTTFDIISEGNPIVPVSMEVTFPVAVQVSFPEDIISNKTGQELDDQIAAYIANVENQYKAINWFSTPDTARNATCTVENLGPHQEEGYTNYRLHITFSLNATVTQPLAVQTDLTGQEKTDFLQAQADAFAVAFKAERNWVDL